MHRLVISLLEPRRWLTVPLYCLLLARMAGAEDLPRKEAYHPSFDPVADTPGLPRVLLIGDSVSMGYTIPTRVVLAGVANVHRPPTNCGATPTGVQRLADWLGAEHWDVIHFNFGLHDLRYLPTGEQLAPPQKYEDNLRAIVARLKKTGAVIVFATTTPVRQNEMRQGKILRRAGAEEAYNAIAKRVMAENGIAVDDLWAAIQPRLGEFQLPNDIHYQPAGYDFLAIQVAASIRHALHR